MARLARATDGEDVSSAGREDDGLSEEVGENRRVRLAPLAAGAARQLDVERALGQSQDAVARGRLDLHVEALDFAIGAQGGVAGQLGPRAPPLRALAIHAHRGGLPLAPASPPGAAA